MLGNSDFQADPGPGPGPGPGPEPRPGPEDLVQDLVQDLVREVQQVKEVDVVICPAFTALGEVSKKVIETNIRLGAQNMSEQAAGAHTGEIAAEMLKEFLVRYVILGHSERRQYQEETDSLISKKALAAHAASIKPIVCVGETLEQRDSGVTNDVVGSQVKGSLAGLTSSQMLETIIAYEPVWAIGTGKTASSEQAQEVHHFIRGVLSDLHGDEVDRLVRIHFGGSVYPGNARELMSQPDIDGALVGGASLDAKSFSEIILNSI